MPDADITRIQPDERPDRLVKLLWSAIILVAILAGIERAASLAVGPDELEHLHAAWLWSNGVPPYTGFFEHHPPAYWLLLRPVVALFSGPRDLQTLVLAARGLEGLILLGCAAAVGLLASRLAGRQAGWFAAGLWALFCASDAEPLYARPDMPMLLLLVGGTVLCLDGFGLTDRHAKPSVWRSFAAGLLLAAACCVLPKAIFWIACLLATLAGWAVIGAVRDRQFSRLASLAAAVAGMCLWAGLFIRWIVAYNDLGLFWKCNVTVNRGHLGFLLTNIPMLKSFTLGLFSLTTAPLLLAAVGLVWIAGRAGPQRWIRLAVVAGLLLGGIGLTVLAGGPFGQYQFPLRAVLAVLAAAGLAAAAAAMGPWTQRAAAAAVLCVVVGWLLVIRPAAGDWKLKDSLQPYQYIVDHAQPQDTCVSVTNYNPVLVMDTDPQRFVYLQVFKSAADVETVLNLIEDRQPRFVCGFGAYIWKGANVGAEILKYSQTLTRDYQEIAPGVLMRRQHSAAPSDHAASRGE